MLLHVLDFNFAFLSLSLSRLKSYIFTYTVFTINELVYFFFPETKSCTVNVKRASSTQNVRKRTSKS